MHTDGFGREIVLRREISQLEEKVAGLMEIQVRGELYKDKVVGEFQQLERENDSLKFEIEGLRLKLAQSEVR